MSKYTTEVRYICEEAAGLVESVGLSRVYDIIGKARPKIFDFSYPIFDNAYKTGLEEKILHHFYTREIGFETVGLWKLKLAAKMREIMPLMNQYYKSALVEYDPMNDVDYRKEYEQKTKGNVTSLSSTEASDNREDWALHSDTPQGALDNIENENYLSDINKTYGNGASRASTSSNADRDDTTNYLEHVYGRMGGFDVSERILKAREAFLNVDMMIINELEELFFGLW